MSAPKVKRTCYDDATPSLRETRRLAAIRYAHDPEYGKPPRWSRLYAKHCPQHTDGCSRHVRQIADILRDPQSPLRQWLMDEGYEPDHWARSMEVTVKSLWEARAEIDQLKGPERVEREHAEAVERLVKRLNGRKDGSAHKNTHPTKET